VQHVRYVLLAVLLLFSGYPVNAGDAFSLTWFSFNDGLAHAKKTNKKILVDVYTDWCGWCKRMDKETYSDGGVAAYLNKHYVAIKLNAESSSKVTYNGETYTQQELAGAFGITGYPSIIFLKGNGEPITTYPGYADAAMFKKVASFIAEDHYLTKKFEDYVRGTE
jgi:thioredoxin-related protein